jgi:hypothetical protein
MNGLSLTRDLSHWNPSPSSPARMQQKNIVKKVKFIKEYEEIEKKMKIIDNVADPDQQLDQNNWKIHIFCCAEFVPWN